MARRVVIIGGGIIGAMLAQELSASADVTVIDAGHANASRASFGWINASFHHDDHHFRLRHRGMQRWRAVAERLDLPLRWCGALWWEEQGAGLRAFQAKLDGLGYGVHHLDGAALRDRLGAVRNGPDEALFFAQEGVLETGAAADKLLARSGISVMRGVAVQGVETQGGMVTGVRVEGGVIAADQVVVAAGTGAAPLAENAGIALPMLRRPGVTFLTQPVFSDPMPIMVAPEMEFRVDPHGRLMAPTSPAHQGDTTEALRETPLELARAARDRLSDIVGVKLEIKQLQLANRPVPQDGLPVIGQGGPKGLYWAVMHSGVTLAAISAQLLAREMQSGQVDDLLAPYRPGRFGA